MQTEKPSEQDVKLMDRALREARTDLAYGGAGVAALLASPDQIIGVAHNTIQETGDLTNHAEMVLLHGVSRQLREMDEQDRHALSLYVTLEPCLMCSAALSFAGIKRIVYAALAEDANIEEMIVRDLTLPKINQQLRPRAIYLGARRTPHGRPGLIAPDEQSSRRSGRSQNLIRLASAKLTGNYRYSSTRGFAWHLQKQVWRKAGKYRLLA